MSRLLPHVLHLCVTAVAHGMANTRLGQLSETQRRLAQCAKQSTGGATIRGGTRQNGTAKSRALDSCGILPRNAASQAAQLAIARKAPRKTAMQAVSSDQQRHSISTGTASSACLNTAAARPRKVPKEKGGNRHDPRRKHQEGHRALQSRAHSSGPHTSQQWPSHITALPCLCCNTHHSTAEQSTRHSLSWPSRSRGLVSLVTHSSGPHTSQCH